MTRVLLWTAALAYLCAPVSGQTVRLDEGTFRVLINDREAGTETFSLRQNGAGEDAIVIAQGRVLVDANETTANAQFAGTDLRLVAFDVELTGADARRIRASIARGRASSRTLSASGETMREYLVSDGAVLLDEGIAHHYYVVAKRAAAGATAIPVLMPRENRQVQATIARGGTETLTIGSSSVQAQKVVVTLPGGDVRTIWADDQGRVLRVEVPGRNYAAVRTALPQ